MINSNRNYNLNDYNKQIKSKKRSYQRRLAIMQRLFVSLLIISVSLGLVFIVGLLNKSATKAPDEPLFDFNNNTTTTTEDSSALSIDTEPTTTETQYTVREILPTNPLADSYWGELVPCENPIPYEHYEVRGLYTNAAWNFEHCLDICDNSQINSLVIDLKEEYGVYFDTTNEFAREINCVYPQYDLEELIATCHEHNIHVIGRIVCFKDPFIVNAHPERAICDSNGQVLHFWNEGSSAFASPYDSRNWDFFIELAEEAIAMGIDEIQFDYVRFPTGGTNEGTSPYFGIESEVPTRSDAINRFMQTARIRLQDTYGIPVSFDIFGIAVTSQLDGEILGQNWATVGLTQADSVCPMIYPSHYALGTVLNREYDKPDQYPYDIMYNALLMGSIYHNQRGYSVVRPYVQAFTAAYLGSGNYMEYDYNAINDQIRAIQDAGSGEFILWNAAAEYPDGNYGGNYD